MYHIQNSPSDERNIVHAPCGAFVGIADTVSWNGPGGFDPDHVCPECLTAARAKDEREKRAESLPVAPFCASCRRGENYGVEADFMVGYYDEDYRRPVREWLCDDHYTMTLENHTTVRVISKREA